ncbi:hypothetical protein GCM10027517_25310 [Phycicoccus ginsengisoli]
MTSYASRSIARMTPAAVAHETACSEERPPKTMATRGLRGVGWSVLIADERIPPGGPRRHPPHPTPTLAA